MIDFKNSRSSSPRIVRPRTIYANGKNNSAAYAPFCKEYAVTSARGVRKSASFDTLCRLTRIEAGAPHSDPLNTLEVGSVRELREFRYDDLGRLTRTEQSTASPSTYGQAVYGTNAYGDGLGSVEAREYFYDSLDRLEKVVFEDGKEMSYLYDAEGNVTQVTENASSSTPKVTQFSYLGDNRLHQVTYVRSGGNQVFTYTYDAGGRPLTLTYPTSTGIVAHFNGPSSEVGWDGNGQLKHLRYVKGATTLRRFAFLYDAAGNRTEQLDVTPTKATRWAYGYDWLDRLESVKKAEAATVGALGALQLVSMYSYDAADNRTEFQVPALNETYQYSFDDADNITLVQRKVGAGAFANFETFTPADDDGNMTSRTRGGVTTTYHWDDFNRLKAISTSDNSKNQSHTFGISGFRRKKKDKNNVETTEYAAGLSTEVSKATGGETITYLKTGGGITGFERLSDGAMFYFITDALSTVRDVVNSSGAVVASYEFNEYGQKISPANTGGVESQKTFVGGMSVQDEVADTGLMMMGHRFYEPFPMGRFLNRDPIGFKGGLNLYEYSRSSPALLVDPAGLEPPHSVMDRRVGINLPRAAYESSGPMNEEETEIFKLIVGMAIEPADWVFTAEDIYENGLEPAHFIGLLPFVTYGMAKGIKKFQRTRAAKAARDKAYLSSCSGDGLVHIKVQGHPGASATLFAQDEVLRISALYRGSLGRGAGPELLKIALEHVPDLEKYSKVILGDVLQKRSAELLRAGFNPMDTPIFRAISDPVQSITGKTLSNVRATTNRGGNFDIEADLL